VPLFLLGLLEKSEDDPRLRALAPYRVVLAGASAWRLYLFVVVFKRDEMWGDDAVALFLPSAPAEKESTWKLRSGPSPYNYKCEHL